MLRCACVSFLRDKYSYEEMTYYPSIHPPISSSDHSDKHTNEHTNEPTTPFQAQLKTDPDAVPFDEIIQCNIGNPQSLGQLPLSFHRRVLSLTMVPELVDEMAEVVGTFKQDVVARAKKYIASVPSMGAYTHSQGKNPGKACTVGSAGRQAGRLGKCNF